MNKRELEAALEAANAEIASLRATVERLAEPTVITIKGPSTPEEETRVREFLDKYASQPRHLWITDADLSQEDAAIENAVALAAGDTVVDAAMRFAPADTLLTDVERVELENFARSGAVSRCARDAIARLLGLDSGPETPRIPLGISRTSRG